ncbi:hypothetical protein [uncultured Polaribacter sp.]|uniref:hypothetical protein n=1 Tax=uncultured Polaribacter sp. TaxID=174711 RepID=UPI00345A3F99
MKKLFKLTFFILIFCLVSIFVSNYSIEQNAQTKIFSEVKNIQKNKVGLLLGTAKTLQNGQLNLYYKYRLDATIALFKAKK